MYAVANPIEYRIYMAGDIAAAKQVCREFCFEKGFCVTVTPTTYIYKGGDEEGFVIGVINYARFPLTSGELHERVKALADELMIRCYQNSYTIFGPRYSEWTSRREE